MSAFKFIKNMKNFLMLAYLGIILLSMYIVVSSNSLTVWFFTIIPMYLTVTWHAAFRPFVRKHKFDGDEKIVTMMPFTSLYSNTTILDATKISFKSSIYLTIDGSLYYEVALMYDGFVFNEMAVQKTVPIKVNLRNCFKVVSFDNEYFYKNYHAPIARELIRGICIGEYELKSNSMNHNDELADSRVRALKNEFGAA